MSREKKVGLVSALGSGFEIVKGLVEEVEEQGGTENDVRKLLSSGDLRQRLAKMLVGKTKVVWTGEVTVDHNRSYDERVKAYGLTMSQMPKLYPIVPWQFIGRVRLTVTCFGRVMSVGDMEGELSKHGLKHAGAEDAIAFGAQHQMVVYKFDTIMSLGDSKFSEQKPPVSESAIPFYGKIGSKIYFDALSLSWSIPGNLTLSTRQFFNGTWPGCCVLCRTA